MKVAHRARILIEALELDKMNDGMLEETITLYRLIDRREAEITMGKWVPCATFVLEAARTEKALRDLHKREKLTNRIA